MINKIFRGLSHIIPFYKQKNIQSTTDIKVQDQATKVHKGKGKINLSLIHANPDDSSDTARKTHSFATTSTSLSPRDSPSSSPRSIVTDASESPRRPLSLDTKAVIILNQSGIKSRSDAEQIVTILQNTSDSLALEAKKNDGYATTQIGKYPIHFIVNQEGPNKVEIFVETGKFLGKGASKEVVKAVNLKGKQVALAFINHDEENLIESQAQSKHDFEMGQVFKDSSLYTQIGGLTGIERANGKLVDIEVMEFCGKGDLKTYLNNNAKKLAGSQIIQLYTQCVKGVLEAHKKGYTLHDIKLENFLVDNNGNIKVSDYGLFAKTDTTTEQQYEEGTRPYFPPEMQNRQKPTPHLAMKKDWYSEGLTLQGILGRGEQSRLVGEKTSEKIAWAQKQRELQENTPFKNPLESLVLAMLHEDPKKRIGDDGVEQAIDHIEKLVNLYKRNESNPPLNASELCEYFNNIAFALEYNLVDIDDIKGVFEGISNLKENDQHIENLGKAIEANKSLILKLGGISRNELNNIIKNNPKFNKKDFNQFKEFI